MKKLGYLFVILLMVCCKSETKNSSETPNVYVNAEKSRVIITLDGMDYHSPVRCSFFSEDYFFFNSDKLETTDTNGDDIVITGHQQGDKMILTLTIKGKTYSATNLGLQKRKFTAMGAGKLFSEDGTESYKATYKVICQ